MTNTPRLKTDAWRFRHFGIALSDLHVVECFDRMPNPYTTHKIQEKPPVKMLNCIKPESKSSSLLEISPFIELRNTKWIDETVLPEPKVPSGGGLPSRLLAYDRSTKSTVVFKGARNQESYLHRNPADSHNFPVQCRHISTTPAFLDREYNRFGRSSSCYPSRYLR